MTELEIAEQLGPILRTAMGKAGYETQKDLASAVPCTQGEVSAYVNGTKLPGWPRFLRLCEVLDIKPLRVFQSIICPNRT